MAALPAALYHYFAKPSMQAALRQEGTTHMLFDLESGKASLMGLFLARQLAKSSPLQIVGSIF